jgi:heme-degrading monooxygenase HmoA
MAPPLPWRNVSEVHDTETYVLVTTRLPLSRYRHIPAVMRATLRIVRELARSDGLVGYSLHAQLARKTFWTVSAWRTEDDVDRFVRSPAHRAAMTGVGRHVDDARIDTAVVAGSDLPPRWKDVHRELGAERAGPAPSRTEA